MKLFVKEIIVTDRIRKDLGSIQELAEDIKANGLINPIVVNEENVLLAGERRLEAVKLLGWAEVPVTVMQTRGREHELNIEISENEARKEFSRAERADYMKRMLEAEKAKAKERQGERTSVRNQTEVLRADAATAKEFGIGKDTLRKELAISEHQDLLEPEDFADWDEGRLSTNKAYQKLKEKLKQAEAEADRAKRLCSEEQVKGIRLRAQVDKLKAEQDGATQEAVQAVREELSAAREKISKAAIDHAVLENQKDELAYQLSEQERELQKAKAERDDALGKLRETEEVLASQPADSKDAPIQVLAMLTADFSARARLLWAKMALKEASSQAQEECRSLIGELRALADMMTAQADAALSEFIDIPDPEEEEDDDGI